MNKRTIWIGSAAGAAALVLGGAAIAFATPTPSPSGNDGTDADDQVLVGSDLDRASEAALAETGGGTVVDSEADSDGDSAYEVEVLLDDGTVKEVELDADFTFVRFDDEGGGSDDGAGDVDDDSDDAAGED
ncbi:PepSY domain-containing protein [Agromyces humatus]|uniref:PepSY domain-containing protein n=1 Tax=Agromyces humatus TaxID=279573 RepID=A0ABN2KKS4_9MICO|nr:PepSY domain-containing protein [Agromyces humatus]